MRFTGTRPAGRGLVSSIALMASACIAAPLAAQDAPAAQSPDDQGILVTGLRRSTALQDTPAAVTAFDAEAIRNAGIERPADFIALTPNVNLVETQNAGNAFVIIRGITQNRNSEPSVAVIVDGVQQVNPAQFNQELFDIEQIEVLKGPQGGLYGRNAIGGAIIITTKAPTDELSGNVTAGIDNGFGYYLRGGISGPLAENVKFRVAGSWYDTNGFIPNTFLGEDADPVEDFSLRANLLVEASERLTFDLRGSVNQLRTQGLYYNIVNDVNDVADVRVNNPGQNDRDIYNAALKIEYAGDNAVLTSISSYDTVKEVLTGDAFDFLPIPESFFFNLFEFLFGPGNGFDLNQSQYLNVKAFSQEVRLASPEDGRKFNWMVGGYLIDTTRFISTGNMVDTGNGVFPVFRSPSTNPLNPQFSYLADGQENFAWALFANAGYEFSDQLRVDASLRYDRDRRRQTTLTPKPSSRWSPACRRPRAARCAPRCSTTGSPRSRSPTSRAAISPSTAAIRAASGRAASTRRAWARKPRPMRSSAWATSSRPKPPTPSRSAPRHSSARCGWRARPTPPSRKTRISSSSSPSPRPRTSATSPRRGSTASSWKRPRGCCRTSTSTPRSG